MNLVGIIVAHDEDLILDNTIKKWELPYIAVLDNPTDKVRELTKSSIHIIETEKQVGKHIYQWENILGLIKEAALYARDKNFKWTLRIDADEDWQGAIEEIREADKQGFNIINFRIHQFKPLKDSVSVFTPDDQQETIEGDAIHLHEFGNFYQRAWKLDTDNFNLGGGGHVILRGGQKIYQANYRFKHYPANDKDSLTRKANRNYSTAEIKKRGWHIQYDEFKTQEPKPEPELLPQRVENIHLFYHIAIMGRWRKVLAEQVKQLQDSGILEKCKSATAVYVGNEDIMPQLPKQFTIQYGGNLKSFEFPTLNKIHEKATSNPNDAFCYIHTKGISKPQRRAWLDNEWRKYMMFGCIEHHKECIDSLKLGYDVAGVEWYPNLKPGSRGGTAGDCHGFFAGNFWWATAKHINSLPNIETVDKSYRWNAEAWIGLGDKPKAHEVINIQTLERPGMFARSFNRESYVNKDNIIYVDVIGFSNGRSILNKKINKAVETNSVVFVKGVKEKFINNPNFLQVKSEPKRFTKKVEITI